MARFLVTIGVAILFTLFLFVPSIHVVDEASAFQMSMDLSVSQDVDTGQAGDTYEGGEEDSINHQEEVQLPNPQGENTEEEHTGDSEMYECGPDHMAMCDDNDTCANAGGYWHDGNCSKTRPVHYGMAGEASPLEVMYLMDGEPVADPGHHQEQVQPGMLSVGCSLDVPVEDQGQEARLLLYAYSPDMPEIGFVNLSELLSIQQTTLSDEVEVEFEADLGPLAGWTFDIYCGYQLQDGTIGYNAYELNIQDNAFASP